MPLSFVLVSALFLAGCSDKNSPSAPQSTNTSSGGGSLATAPVDYVSALGKAENRAIKAVDVAALNQAIQLFNVQEGRFPKDLNELVASKLINNIPQVPNGMKLDYDATAGTIKVVPQ
ncbi:MAG: hypothetical protein JWR19_1830 [Pedosphaera sp.]|nr:hypothetical protein [Pedosphaera sp.]